MHYLGIKLNMKGFLHLIIIKCSSLTMKKGLKDLFLWTLKEAEIKTLITFGLGLILILKKIQQFAFGLVSMKFTNCDLVWLSTNPNFNTCRFKSVQLITWLGLFLSLNRQLIIVSQVTFNNARLITKCFQLFWQFSQNYCYCISTLGTLLNSYNSYLQSQLQLSLTGLAL